MMSLLLVAIALLLGSVTVYVLFRRQRHGGLAGGSGMASPPRTQAGRGPGRTFTPAEVEKHCTADSLWLIIKDKVYDFTDYMPLHPGGEAIMRNAGKDSTVGFSGSQHPARVWDMVRLVNLNFLAFLMGGRDGGIPMYEIQQLTFPGMPLCFAWPTLFNQIDEFYIGDVATYLPPSRKDE